MPGAWVIKARYIYSVGIFYNPLMTGSHPAFSHSVFTKLLTLWRSFCLQMSCRVLIRGFDHDMDIKEGRTPGSGSRIAWL